MTESPDPAEGYTPRHRLDIPVGYPKSKLPIGAQPTGEVLQYEQPLKIFNRKVRSIIFAIAISLGIAEQTTEQTAEYSSYIRDILMHSDDSYEYEVTDMEEFNKFMFDFRDILKHIENYVPLQASDINEFMNLYTAWQEYGVLNNTDARATFEKQYATMLDLFQNDVIQLAYELSKIGISPRDYILASS